MLFKVKKNGFYKGKVLTADIFVILFKKKVKAIYY